MVDLSIAMLVYQSKIHGLIQTSQSRRSAYRSQPPQKGRKGGKGLDLWIWDGLIWIYYIVL